MGCGVPRAVSGACALPDTNLCLGLRKHPRNPAASFLDTDGVEQIGERPVLDLSPVAAARGAHPPENSELHLDRGHKFRFYFAHICNFHPPRPDQQEGDRISRYPLLRVMSLSGEHPERRGPDLWADTEGRPDEFRGRTEAGRPFRDVVDSLRNAVDSQSGPV